jgi:hypothetical protein
VVSQGKKTSLADCFLSNESGDWALYLKYHFRADGSLARLSADLRHFNCFQQGDREQRFFLGQVFWEEYFRPDGTPIGETEPRCFDRETKTPVKGMTGWESKKETRPLYLKATDLPFLTPNRSR